MSNKYEQLNTSALIAGIQLGCLQLLDPAVKKKGPAAKLSRIKTEVNEMRREVIPRLLALDRNDPKFFPKGCHVLYHKYSPPQDIDDWGPSKAIPDRNGIVIEHDTRKVLVQFEGDQFFVRVDPGDLKIKFIR